MLNHRKFIIGLVSIVASASCGGKGIEEGGGGSGAAGLINDGRGGGAGETNGAQGGSSGTGLAPGIGGSAHGGVSGGGSGAAHGGSLGFAGRGGAGGDSGASHGGASHGGAAGSAGAGSSSLLGATCSSDAQCGAGMVCLTAGSNALGDGGPAGGLCTLSCNSTTDCDAVQQGADCFNFGTAVAPKLYCLAACVQGGDATTATNKCQGRSDFACVDLSTTSAPEPFCLPLCRADVECGAGLFCNKATGLCSAAPGGGDPLGSPCTPNVGAGAGSDNCAGFCLRTSADGVLPAKGVCSEYCAGLLDCAYHGTQPGGLCYGQISDSFGLLDLGYCLPACTCTTGCPLPGDLCRAWAPTQQSFADELGAPGLCVPDVTGSVELSACGEAGAAGSGP